MGVRAVQILRCLVLKFMPCRRKVERREYNMEVVVLSTARDKQSKF